MYCLFNVHLAIVWVLITLFSYITYIVSNYILTMSVTHPRKRRHFAFSLFNFSTLLKFPRMLKMRLSTVQFVRHRRCWWRNRYVFHIISVFECFSASAASDTADGNDKKEEDHSATYTGYDVNKFTYFPIVVCSFGSCSNCNIKR